jgi:hypothetical protein
VPGGVAGLSRIFAMPARAESDDGLGDSSVYLGQGGLLPIRIRVFLGFLAQQIKIGEARPTKEA